MLDSPNDEGYRGQRRSLRTRSTIIDAALVEFAHCGYAGATTRGIAVRAGVNHTLITHHFGNKDALWRATAEHLFSSYRRRVRLRLRAVERVEEVTLLRAVLREFIVFCRDFPEFQRFVFHANSGDPERFRWLAQQFLLPDALTGSNLIERAQRAGLVCGGDSMHLRYLFVAAATAIFTLGPEFGMVTGCDPFDDRVLERHVDLVLKVFAGAAPRD